MPAINCIAEFDIKRPVRKILHNGIVLNILDTGKEDVVRLDLVMGCGQVDQKFPLQAMMTNRMLREGTAHMTSAQIAEKLDFYGAWLDLSSSVNSGFITLYSLGKFFGHTIKILAEMVKEPVFPEREPEDCDRNEQADVSGKLGKGGSDGQKKAKRGTFREGASAGQICGAG